MGARTAESAHGMIEKTEKRADSAVRAPMLSIGEELRRRLAWIGAWVTIIAAAVQLAFSQSSQTKSPTKTESGQPGIELRGRIVCLAEEMHRLYEADLPTRHEHIYGLKTNDGKFVTLLRNKHSEALFADKRLHEKELILKGRLFPQTQIFEAITFRSVRNGVIHELFYHCGVCEIYTFAPGICECCQDPMELVERPQR